MYERVCTARTRATRFAIGQGDFERHRASFRRVHAILRGRRSAAYIVFMRETPNPKSLPDDELLRRLSTLVNQSRRVEADLVAHIAEVDARRLYAREGTPSMFAYCTERLHLSEAETWLRIRVARASRKHPMLLDMLRDGRLHITGIVVLVPHLTPDNRKELLERAVHKTRRQIEEIVAEVAPREEVPAVIRKLPTRSGPAVPAAADPLTPQAVGRAGSQLTPETVGAWDRANAVGPVPGLDAVPPGARPGRVEPLAPARFKVEFTADAELREMLERLQALMRSSSTGGDLASVVKVAVAEKLERLEARRFGKTKAPRKKLAETDTTPKSRHMPAAVRRAVFERDGGQCTYVDAQGRCCTERHNLEFHHRKTPFGRGGDHSPDSVTLHCRAHNLLMAEQEYGEEKMAQFRRSSDRVSEPMAVYATGSTVRAAERTQARGPGPPAPPR